MHGDADPRRVGLAGVGLSVVLSVGNYRIQRLSLLRVRSGNELCFSFGYVESQNRKRVEAAFIFKHKPPENDEYKNEFPFDNTTIKSEGRTALLSTNFTVYRT